MAPIIAQFRTCDFCHTRALCITIEDAGDGGITYACGRCASSGKAAGVYAPQDRPLATPSETPVAPPSAEPSDSRWMEQGGAEWKRVFLLLPGGPLAECPDCGEVWQYMGTWLRGGLWLHNFRHRHHPDNGKRRYINIVAAPNWT